jgi:hypothetical protein
MEAPMKNLFAAGKLLFLDMASTLLADSVPAKKH